MLVVLFAASVMNYAAETYYVFDGYVYYDAQIENDTVVFCGMEEPVQTLTVPNNIGVKTVIEIADEAFFNDNVLSSIDLSQVDNLIKIGASAFRGCTSLESLTIPESTLYIGKYMLSGCSSLQTLTFNNSPVGIPDEMCNRCTSLNNVIIPDSVQSISRFAFANCTSLQYVEIPASVTSIAASAFNNDPNLTLGVYNGSYAHNYAVENNIPFTLLDGSIVSVMLGDANGSDSVNVNDVTSIQRHVAQLEMLEGISLIAADINGDGTVGIDDVTEIQRFLAEYTVDYPIGEVITQ